jgi:hypothetical protein
MVHIEPVPPEVAPLLEVRETGEREACAKEKGRREGGSRFAHISYAPLFPPPLNPPPFQDTAWRPQRMSETDKAPQATLSADGTVTSSKGYCVVRRRWWWGRKVWGSTKPGPKK